MRQFPIARATCWLAVSAAAGNQDGTEAPKEDSGSVTPMHDNDRLAAAALGRFTLP